MLTEITTPRNQERADINHHTCEATSLPDLLLNVSRFGPFECLILSF
jgi:hypothetical protein